tara:strand:+ start:422 stop:646 length:225 start_codon:yes stop_codon:yes gene_type:complete
MAMDQRICKTGSTIACRPYAARAIDKATAETPNATQVSFSLFRKGMLQTYLWAIPFCTIFASKKSTALVHLAHM